MPKSVRFDGATKAAPAEDTAAKRSAPSKDNDDTEQPKRAKKRPRMDNRRPNQDEMDDVDEWVADEEDDDNDNGGGAIPTEKQRLDAKRTRREKRQHGGDDDDDISDGDDEDGSNGRRKGNMESTSIDRTTSLATEGIQIEPFHMQNEKSDGTGFFDGDTYVFRKRGGDEDNEPDAWLDGLKDGDKLNSDNNTNKKGEDGSSDDDDEDDDAQQQDPQLGREQLYAKMLPLLSSDKETIMQAVVRIGSLIKRHKPSMMMKNRKKKKVAEDAATTPNTTNEQQQSSSSSLEAAQASLNAVSGTANALLNLGDVDIYQKCRTDLLKLIPQQQPKVVEQVVVAGDSSESISWEYKGLQDGEIHGPYSSQDMRSWTQAGYFVGAQAVQVRNIQQKPKIDSNSKPAVEDLLSDLMDDDDDEEDGVKNNDGQVELLKGEWISSDTANLFG